MLLVNVKKQKKNKTIIKNFTYAFKDTGVYKIEGINGSGKSTLFSIFYKLESKYEGYVKYNNTNIKEFDDLYWRNEIVSYVSQKKTLLKNKTIKENIDILIQTYDKDQYNNFLELFNLRQKEEVLYKNLSGGEQQKVEIIAALLRKSKILLLDEVDRNLDNTSVEILEKILEDVSQSKLVLVISHFDINCQYQDVLNIENKFKENIDIEENRIERDVLKKKKKYKNNTPLYKNYLFSDKFIKLILILFLFCIISLQILVYGSTMRNINNQLSPWVDQKEFDNTMIVYAPEKNLERDPKMKSQVAEDYANLYFEKEDMSYINSLEGVTNIEYAFIPYVNNSNDADGYALDETIFDISEIPKDYFEDYTIEDSSSKRETTYHSMYLLESKDVLKKVNYFNFVSGGLIMGDAPEDNTNQILIPVTYAINYQYTKGDNQLEKIIGETVTLKKVDENGNTKEDTYEVSGIVADNNFYYAYDEQNPEIQRLKLKNEPYMNEDKEESKSYQTEYANYEMNAEFNGISPVSYDEFKNENKDLITGFYVQYEDGYEEEIYNEILSQYPNALIYSNLMFEQGFPKSYFKSYFIDQIMKIIKVFVIFLVVLIVVFYKYLKTYKLKNKIFKFYGFSAKSRNIGLLLSNLIIILFAIIPIILLLILFGFNLPVITTLILGGIYFLILLLGYIVGYLLFRNGME